MRALPDDTTGDLLLPVQAAVAELVL